MAQPDGRAMQKMRDNVAKMKGQLERLGTAKSAEERQKIMAEHMQTMQDSMGMARGMQSGMMMDCPMMHGGMMGKEGMGMMGKGGMGMMGGGQGMMGQGMAGSDDMMAKRMEMMEKRMDMMQMMMQGRMGMPQESPAAPAK
jgi:hypothetical protein